ncbi:putative oligopeptide ABC transporter, permease protein AppC [delta proteobacterium NaphS2]|nr:putative oligopeptide ABC transporter, permease protein AppC [delta proteobacterium NaphS2]
MAETLTKNHEILEGPQAPRQSRFVQQFRLFKENRLAVVGLVIFLAFFITAVAGVVLTSGQDPVFNPSLVRLQEKLQPPLSLPNLETLKAHEVPTLGIYLLGTDDLGRDVFARMLQGAWVSLTVGFVAVGIAVIVGIFLGGLAGYYGQEGICYDQILDFLLLLSGIIFFILKWHKLGFGLFTAGIFMMILSFRARRVKQNRFMPGWLHKSAFSFDTLIMRMVDIMLCFPSFFLILTVVALLPASIYNIMIVIGLTSWMGTTRFVRAEFLSLREQDFVSAAKALGLGNFRIIFRHMMPNAVAPVLVSATIGIATAILTEAGLSFLGFGVPPPYATWGNILSDGKRFIFDAPWLTFVPGIAILIVVLCFNLFGEGLKDALNPKLRQE